MTVLQANDPSAIQGGFANPVFDAQAVFRQVMEAIARPGKIAAIENLTEPPAPLTPVTGAIAATLFDHDTQIWLDPVLARSSDVAGWLAFNTAAPIVREMLDADFAVISDSEALPSLESFSQGTQEYPDRSTTLIVQIAALSGGPGLTLTGPGIQEIAHIVPQGLPDRFMDQWSANGMRFPRGVDVLLAAPEGVIALPRTVKIKRGR
ncbi:phosphonate C-P lyase system protein PhnH [Hoeflea prorocentri]|uniref:Phosphonate C-P lyase system protein PhnH n=1 Tax=Hoeflea prorocentri TaxID=1922333 RepID=A0A9X3UJL0_9HYPH|nr:phosphonate C-P lyase system protein PhnH [Hoeflea prorocentri]MCY6382043.1 phosphonate C-P lyase system protein PhnH [Hoeflea prorocentri]MDA5399843.1 phosphonate C-P lyase system protein PhnH [Hoeflea prorocentri]